MSRKMRKKIQAIMLVFAMVISVFQGIPGLKIDWAPKSQAFSWTVAAEYDNLPFATKNNCVAFARYKVPSLPGGLWNLADKKRIINSYNPVAGAIAIMYQRVNAKVNYGDTVGHVAYVESVNGGKITTLDGGAGGAHIYRAKGTPVELGVIGYYVPNHIETEHDPEGYFDDITSSPGQITVRGWALDRDNTSKAIKVHIYIGDRARSGSTAEVHVIRADQYREDVGRTIGCGYYHGFSATINTSKTGTQNVYAYAINIDKNGNDNGKNNPELQTHKMLGIPAKINYSVNTGSASDIKNKKAVISGSLSPAGNANSWGFYAGTSENEMKKYTVSASSTNSANMKAQIGDYVTLKPGTKYYYQTWAWVNDQEKKGSVSSFVTTAVKPEIPELKVSVDSKDIGVGDAPEFSWKAVDQADYYKLYLYDENGQAVQESDEITGTKYAFGAVDADGVYSACIEAYNEVGTKGKSEIVSFTVHPDVTVKFMDADSFVDAGDDYEPEVLSEQKVHYGKSATKPADPQHKGYTFAKWVGNYSAVKEDAVVKAEYKINQYKVTYIDSVTNEELGSEKVTYYSSANPVDYSVETGYKKTGYDGWDKDYKHITEDTKLYTCFGWYNDNFPIYATITKAKREYDAQESDNEGYTIEAALKNWDTSTTKGRVVAALKTEEGKLLTTTESSAFSIKKSTTKTLEIFVPYDKAASIAEIYVVGQYKDAVPITTTASNNAMLKIDQKDTYTNWSEEKPAENAKNVESRTEYRYQDKSTTTSYETSLAGYTQSGRSWVRSGGGSIDYVSSFPAGFNTGSIYYSSYHKNPLTAYENSTNKRDVSTSVAGYLYWH